jgi:amidase
MADVDPFESATELLATLRAGRATSSELTDLYIRRIERHDGRPNAVVVPDFERARRQARAADQAAARGDGGALLGLPVTIISVAAGRGDERA